jgi:hypothetical protein
MPSKGACRFVSLEASFGPILPGLVASEKLLVSLKLIGMSVELRTELEFAGLDESAVCRGLSGEMLSLRSQPFSW